MITKLITVSCLVILILELLFVIINVLCKKRAQRIAFLRSFKKGKCAIIYITAIPLYCLGHMHSGQGFLAAFFNAVNKIVSLVVLRYDIETIEGLMLIDPLYNFTIYFWGIRGCKFRKHFPCRCLGNVPSYSGSTFQGQSSARRPQWVGCQRWRLLGKPTDKVDNLRNHFR